MTQKSIGRIVLAVLTALTATVTAMAIMHASSTPTVSSATAGRAQGTDVGGALSVLFVGDSFAAGGGVENDHAYPALIGRKAHWNVHVDAQGGTGFIADGEGTGNGNTSRLMDRLAEDWRQLPEVDLLIIDAGRNDLSYPTGDIAAALSEYIAQARRQWPAAEIVQILPAFLTSTPYDTYPELLREVNSSLAAVDGFLIDPFAEGWYTGADVDSMVTTDKVHPNRHGSAHIADRLLASLRDKGLIPAA